MKGGPALVASDRQALSEAGSEAAYHLDDRVLALALDLEGWVARLAILGDLLPLGLNGSLLCVLLGHLPCITYKSRSDNCDTSCAELPEPCVLIICKKSASTHIVSGKCKSARHMDRFIYDEHQLSEGPPYQGVVTRAGR